MFDLLRMVVPIMAFGIIGFVAVFMFITITKMADRHREDSKAPVLTVRLPLLQNAFKCVVTMHTPIILSHFSLKAAIEWSFRFGTANTRLSYPVTEAG